MPRFSRARRALAISVVLTAGMFGCELIVSSSVPDFNCTAGDPASCPTNMSCDPIALKCVSGLVDGNVVDVVGTDGNTRPDSGNGSETGGNGAAIGSKCTSDSSCQAGLVCGTTNILTTNVVDSTENSICTKSCCTSADCPASYVCFGPGTGGNYCISATLAQRGAVGDGTPGAACAGDTDCRSGVCDTTSHCLDTCCSANDCAAGTTCRVKTINTKATENWVCAVPEDGSSLDTGASCSSTTKTCKDDNCSGFPQKCRPSCCSSKECSDTGSGFGVCAYGQFLQTSAYAKWCFDAVDGGTGLPLGAACGGDTDCASRICDHDHSICAAICCQDSDCANNQVCRPTQSSTPYLRCVNNTAQ